MDNISALGTLINLRPIKSIKCETNDLFNTILLDFNHTKLWRC